MWFNEVDIHNLVRLYGDLRLSGPVYRPGVLSMTVPTVPGKTYTLPYKTNLFQPNWISLPLVAAGDGGLKLLTDDGAVSRSRMYRVVEQ
jgi:hypothetical protein